MLSGEIPILTISAEWGYDRSWGEGRQVIGNHTETFASEKANVNFELLQILVTMFPLDNDQRALKDITIFRRSVRASPLSDQFCLKNRSPINGLP
jgi:hypothetical protein